jgi:hypothetical protein
MLHNLRFIFFTYHLLPNFIFFCFSNTFFINHMLKFMYQLGCLKVNLLFTYITTEMHILMSENIINSWLYIPNLLEICASRVGSGVTDMMLLSSLNMYRTQDGCRVLQCYYQKQLRPQSWVKSSTLPPIVWAVRWAVRSRVPSPSLRDMNAQKVSFYENGMSLGAKTDIYFAFRLWLACELI